MAREPILPSCQRLRPLAQYSRRLPSSRRGKRLSRATLWRWALRGARGGRRLRTVQLGAGRLTCDAWVWEFLKHSDVGRAQAQPDAATDRFERERIARELGVTPVPGTPIRPADGR